MTAVNPYQTPAVEDPPLLTVKADNRRVLYIAWSVVFAVNILAPLAFSWSITDHLAKTGLCIAAISLLIAGEFSCYVAPNWARLTIVGAAALALLQVFPIVHVAAGLAALAIVDNLGLVTARDPARLTSVLGGFAATLITGLLLVVASTLLGLFIRAAMPRRWWARSNGN